MAAVPAPPAPSSARWTVLALACAGLTGQFYAYDTPSALHDHLKVHMGGENFEYVFGMLYSMYSIPNMVLPLVFGIAVDRIGVQRMIRFLATMVFAGALIFAWGAAAQSVPLMFLGRAVFGIGGESIQVAQTALLVAYFSGAELAFALGVNLSVARVGSVLNDLLSPRLAVAFGVPAVLYFAAALVFVGLVCNFVSVSNKYVSHLSVPVDEKVDLSAVRQMPRSIGLLTGLAVCLYACVLCFNNIGAGLFAQTAFSHLKAEEAAMRAGEALSVLFLVSAIATPAAGFFVDIVGRRATILTISAVLVTCTHLLLLSLPPFLVCILLGSVYTLFASALWPSVSLCVPESNVGCAYGVLTAGQNTGMAVVPVIMAAVQSAEATSYAGYVAVERLLAAFGFCGVLFAMALDHENRTKMKNVLELPSAEIPKTTSKRAVDLSEETPLTVGKGAYAADGTASEAESSTMAGSTMDDVL